MTRNKAQQPVFFGRIHVVSHSSTRSSRWAEKQNVSCIGSCDRQVFEMESSSQIGFAFADVSLSHSNGVAEIGIGQEMPAVPLVVCQ